MPKAALQICSYPGCNTLVKHGRCVKHTPTLQAAPGVKRLYNSALWQQIREDQLAREPWCRACLAQGIHTPATDVDHIERHLGDTEKFYAGPFQSLCHSCHSHKTAVEVGIIPPDGRGAEKVFTRRQENAPVSHKRNIPRSG